MASSGQDGVKQESSSVLQILRHEASQLAWA